MYVSVIRFLLVLHRIALIPDPSHLSRSWSWMEREQDNGPGPPDQWEVLLPGRHLAAGLSGRRWRHVPAKNCGGRKWATLLSWNEFSSFASHKHFLCRAGSCKANAWDLSGLPAGPVAHACYNQLVLRYSMCSHSFLCNNMRTGNFLSVEYKDGGYHSRKIQTVSTRRQMWPLPHMKR